MDEHLLLDLARPLARVAHDGQLRRAQADGYRDPQFAHAQRVSDSCLGLRARTVAYLHDVLEDTDIIASDLMHIGFPFDLVEQVLALTREPGRETYKQYIDRLCRSNDQVVLKVKIADLKDNLSTAGKLEPADARKFQKRYRAALERVEATLLTVQGGSEG